MEFHLNFISFSFNTVMSDNIISCTQQNLNTAKINLITHVSSRGGRLFNRCHIDSFWHWTSVSHIHLCTCSHHRHTSSLSVSAAEVIVWSEIFEFAVNELLLFPQNRPVILQHRHKRQLITAPLVSFQRGRVSIYQYGNISIYYCRHGQVLYFYIALAETSAFFCDVLGFPNYIFSYNI